MKRHQHKYFRRNVGAPKGYLKPIVEDAFAFTGPEISEKKERDYLKAVETGFKPVSTRKEALWLHR